MKYAVYTGSRNLYPDMVPACKSLLVNSDVDKIFLLIEDDTFPERLPDCIETINVSNQTFFKQGGPNMGSQFTYLAMMRAALVHVLPESLDRVLSLDVDTIVEKDISALWDLDLTDYYFAACHEHHRTHNGLLYTNHGVVMYNLDKLRADGKADEVISVLNSRKYTWVEQDVMNYLCQGRILDIPGEYNVCDWTDWEDRRIIHFAGIRKWQGANAIMPYKYMSWRSVFERRPHA